MTAPADLPLPAYCRYDSDDLLLRLRVTPGARKPGITGLFDDPQDGPLLQLAVTAPPADGAANKAVIQLLAKLSGCPKSAFSLERGATNRHKTIRIAGIEPVRLAPLFRAAADLAR